MRFTGEVTAEELQQRLDGAKERMSSQPPNEQQPQPANVEEQQGSSGEGEERRAGGRQAPGRESFLFLSSNLTLICNGLWVVSILIKVFPPH